METRSTRKDRSRSKPNDAKTEVGRGRPKVCVCWCAADCVGRLQRHRSPSAHHDRPRQDQGSGQHRHLSSTPARRRPCYKDGRGAGDAPVPDAHAGSRQVRRSAQARGWPIRCSTPGIDDAPTPPTVKRTGTAGTSRHGGHHPGCNHRRRLRRRCCRRFQRVVPWRPPSSPIGAGAPLRAPERTLR
jgi:hypothetical protein